MLRRSVPVPPPPALSNLHPLAQLRAGRLPERISRLVLGLWLYGASIALTIEGDTGASPWDVFHLGVDAQTPLGFGLTMVATSGVVLLGWLPLRQMPGLGTVANATLLGPLAALHLAALPTPEHLVARVGFTTAGIVVCALGTATYIGAQLGPGPRDGLMTGLARRTGLSIRSVRTGIEVAVLAVGVALGGAFGLGTVAFALGIGPVTQLFLRHLVVPLHPPTSQETPCTSPTSASPSPSSPTPTPFPATGPSPASDPSR